MKNFLEFLISLKLKENRIKEHLHKIEFPYTLGEVTDNLASKVKVVPLKEIKVACVQRTIEPVTTIEAYIECMYGFIKEAKATNCELIVFPEYNFFDLLGLIPGFIHINNYVNEKGKFHKKAKASYDNSKNQTTITTGQEEKGLSSFSFLLEIVAGPIQKALEIIFSELAKKSGLYIYTGSYLIREGASLYNTGALINREGKILGRQKKIHLTDFEEKLNLKRCSNLEVFQLDFGKVAIPICMDATYWETFQIARKKGVDLVILPIANSEEYNHFKALRGIWPRVQETYVYGIKSSLNGWLAGLHFTGKAGIFAPLELTPERKGVVASAEQAEGSYVITGSLKLTQLKEIRQRAEYYGDSNPIFEAKLLDLYSTFEK